MEPHPIALVASSRSHQSPPSICKLAIHLENGALAFVQHQAANREIRSGLDLENLFRIVAMADQPLESLFMAESIYGFLVIEGQGVVHVKADPLNPAHAQVSIAVDLSV
jgi:hypothetical protein